MIFLGLEKKNISRSTQLQGSGEKLGQHNEEVSVTN